MAITEELRIDSRAMLGPLNQMIRGLKDTGMTIDDLNKAGRRASGGARLLTKGLNVLKSVAAAAFRVIAVGVAAGVAGLVAFGRAAYSAYEVSRAAMADVRTSFGDTAEEWISWSGKMQRATTFSDESFQMAATNMRTLVANYGLAEDQVRDLITASADLATLKRLDLLEATERVQSAIRGEAEASEYLGLTLNDTYMANIAFEGSLADTWETLTDAEKAQYRYQEALNQMAYAEGTAAEEATTFRGALARLKNMGQDWLSQVAKKFVPTLDKAGVWLGKNIPNAITALVALFKGDFSTAISAVSGIIARTFGGEGKAKFDEFVSWIQDNLVPLIEDVGQAFRGLGNLLEGDFGTAFDNLVDLLGIDLAESVIEFVSWIQDNLVPLIEDVGQAFRGLGNLLEGDFGTAFDNLVDLLGIDLAESVIVAAEWLGTNLPAAGAALAAFWTGTLQPALQKMGDWLGTNLPVAAAALEAVWSSTLKPALQGLWSFTKDVLLPILAVMAKQMKSQLIPGLIMVGVVTLVALAPFLLLGAALVALGLLWAEYGEQVKITVEQIQFIIAYGMDWIATRVRTAVANFINTWRSNLQMAQTIAEILRDRAISAFGNVVAAVVNLKNQVRNAFSRIKDAIQAVINRINAFVDAIRRVKLPDFLTPGSPTPFEMGLRGIAAAMRDVSAMELPRLSSAMGGVGAPAMASAGVGASVATAPRLEIAVNVYGPFGAGYTPEQAGRGAVDGFVDAARARGIRI